VIEDYFDNIEDEIQRFKILIESYSISKTILSEKQGFISGKITFTDLTSFSFLEFVDLDFKNKIKYRYHYMDSKNNLIFRYDNAPHHQEVGTFPFHKHIATEITNSDEPELFDVLIEIQQTITNKDKK
jgi:hypothetical protein